MIIKEKIIYLKSLKYALILAKNSGQKYNICEIKDFINLKILPPTPLYLNVKPLFTKRCNK